MKLEEVLPLLKDGYKIRRRYTQWRDFYGFLSISEFTNEIVSDNVIDDTYKITKKDLIVDDWELIEDNEVVNSLYLTIRF